MLKDNLGGVLLQVFRVRDDLYHSVPNLITDVIACSAYELEYGVNVPLVGCGVFLGQDGYLEDHFLS